MNTSKKINIFLKTILKSLKKEKDYKNVWLKTAHNQRQERCDKV